MSIAFGRSPQQPWYCFPRTVSRGRAVRYIFSFPFSAFDCAQASAEKKRMPLPSLTRGQEGISAYRIAFLIRQESVFTFRYAFLTRQDVDSCTRIDMLTRQGPVSARRNALLTRQGHIFGTRYVFLTHWEPPFVSPRNEGSKRRFLRQRNNRSGAEKELPYLLSNHLRPLQRHQMAAVRYLCQFAGAVNALPFFPNLRSDGI